MQVDVGQVATGRGAFVEQALDRQRQVFARLATAVEMRLQRFFLPGALPRPGAEDQGLVDQGDEGIDHRLDLHARRVADAGEGAAPQTPGNAGGQFEGALDHPWHILGVAVEGAPGLQPFLPGLAECRAERLLLVRLGKRPCTPFGHWRLLPV